jgi:hypothetical protein
MQMQDGSQLVLVTALAQDDARFVIAVAGFNGMIANDKFCLTRRDELQLTWRRGPARRLR